MLLFQSLFTVLTICGITLLYLELETTTPCISKIFLFSFLDSIPVNESCRVTR